MRPVRFPEEMHSLHRRVAATATRGRPSISARTRLSRVVLTTMLVGAWLAVVPTTGHAVQPGDAQRFATWTGYDAGRFVESATAADFNADGAPDIAWGRNDFFENALSVQLNFGEGTMRPARSYPAVESTTDVASGDLDGDGDIDIVAVAQGNSLQNDVIDIYLNDGEGAFSHSTTDGGDGPASVALQDFNGDGAPDIATANYWSADDVSVLLNNGDGTFGPETRYVVGPQPTGIVSGDFTGDDIPDLAVARLNNDTLQLEVSVLENQGAGTFATDPSPFVIPFPFAGGSPVLDSADFDSDGNADLAMGLIGTDTHWVLLGDGAGGFEAHDYLAGFSAFDILAFDNDGDGDTDIISADGGASFTGSVSILSNNGDGTFAQARFVSSSHQPSGLATADFNRDGLLDLATANRGSSTGAIHPGTPSGSFAQPDVTNTNGTPSSVAPADYDGDGDADVAATMVDAFGSGSTVQVFDNDGAGNLSPQTPFVSPEDRPESLVASDLNGDGSPDLVWKGDNGFRRVVVYALNNGDGTFGAPQTHSVTTCAEGDVNTADVDNDGDQDLIVPTGSCSDHQSVISISLNDGAGNFAPDYLVETAPLPTEVAGGDLNGDGLTDLFVAGPWQVSRGDVTVLIGTGDGQFTLEQEYVTEHTHVDLKLIDVDSDTDLDAVMANFDDTTTVMRNDGAGGFADSDTLQGESISNLLNEVAVDVGDLNGDGAIDIVVANRSGNDVGAHYGRGDGTFDPAQLRYGMNTGLRDIALADFDGDGRLDIAVPNSVPGSSAGSTSARKSARGLGAVPREVFERAPSSGIEAQAVRGISVAFNLVPRLPCTLRGTPVADRLIGTAGPDLICGLGGNDTIIGRGGNDTVLAGPGADRISGGAGNDSLNGQAGNDDFDGGEGTDRCRQGPGLGRKINCE